MMVLQGTVDSHSQQQEKKKQAAASVSKQLSSSSSSSSSSSHTSIPSPSPPKRSTFSSAPRAHRPQQFTPRPSGVPVLEPPALQPALPRQGSHLHRLPFGKFQLLQSPPQRAPTPPQSSHPPARGVHRQIYRTCQLSISQARQPAL